MLQLKSHSAYGRVGPQTQASSYGSCSLYIKGRISAAPRLQCVGSSAPSAVTVQQEVRAETSQIARDSAPAASSEAQPSCSLRDVSPQELQELIKGDKLVCIDFYTNWCGPCKMMEKELDKLSLAFVKIEFAKFNCGTYEEYATQHRIRSLPTFRLYQRGRCLDQITGARPVQLRQLLSHYYRPF